jgi:transposase
MARYVGLDAHSKRSVYVIEDEMGQVVDQGNVTTTLEGLLLLRSRGELPAGTPVALESGTMAFRVARQLRQMDLDPQVIDASEVRAKAIRPNQKSDRRDALELCEGIRRGLYRTRVHVPPVEIEQLRETLSRRRHFVRVKTREVNAAKHLLRSKGLSSSARSLGTESAWNKLISSLQDDPLLRATCSAHRALWRCANDQVRSLETLLHEQKVAFQADVDRLQKVPGVGLIVALTVIAVFSDARRFPTAKHAASYAGLVSSTYDSGDRVRHGHITKRGSDELRAMLCEAAHHARRSTNPLHPYFTRVCIRRGYKMAIVAVAHRLCRILWALLSRGDDFDLTRLGVEEGHFEQKIVRRYRRRTGTT